MAKILRERGLKIISPAELDSEGVKKIAAVSIDGGEFDRAKKGAAIGGETTGEILARDIRIIHDLADGLIFLPGWELSRGARLEAFVAANNLKDMEFYRWQDDTGIIDPVSISTVMHELYTEWVWQRSDHNAR